MTPLGARIADLVAESGPMRLDRYMALCLSDPEHGYYMRRDPFGAAGDFVTAPEISQMFGELLGAWAMQIWIDQGQREPLTLAELGPGRGTLMRDALRVLDRLCGPHAPPRSWLVETSPRLRHRQAETLAGTGAGWLASVEDLPQSPMVILANEFFDALPIRQFQRAGMAWRERLVAAEAGALHFVWGPLSPDHALDRRFPHAHDGAVVELCAAAETMVAGVAGRVGRHGGALLIVDYGAWDGTGDTLQAAQAHRPVSPLAAPGAADLTAHVRFCALASAAGEIAVSGPVPQGAFLRRLGIDARAEALSRGQPATTAEAVATQHRRLTHGSEMGNLFQVLALTPKAAPPPPGFAP